MSYFIFGSFSCYWPGFNPAHLDVTQWRLLSVAVRGEVSVQKSWVFGGVLYSFWSHAVKAYNTSLRRSTCRLDWCDSHPAPSNVAIIWTELNLTWHAHITRADSWSQSCRNMKTLDFSVNSRQFLLNCCLLLAEKSSVNVFLQLWVCSSDMTMPFLGLLLELEKI